MSGKQPESGAALYVGRRAFVHLGLKVGVAALAAPLLGGAAAPSTELHILAFGDSLTAGFGLPPRQGFAPQLQAYLRRQGVRAFVTNGGVSGDTAAQGLQRLVWTLDGMARKPDLTIVALGANDMLRGLPPARTREALEAILVELKRRGIRILLSGMVASPNLGQAFAADFNRIYPELAARHRTVLHPFFLEGVAADRTLNQPDGLHPNFEGVKRMVMGIAPMVIEAANRQL